MVQRWGATTCDGSSTWLGDLSSGQTWVPSRRMGPIRWLDSRSASASGVFRQRVGERLRECTLNSYLERASHDELSMWASNRKLGANKTRR